MITQAIHLLTLHIMWKAQALTSNPDPSADEVKFRETLREHRAFLLEKVTEYAIGTQSNTIDGVKRAVRYPFDLDDLRHKSHSPLRRSTA